MSWPSVRDVGGRGAGRWSRDAIVVFEFGVEFGLRIQV